MLAIVDSVSEIILNDSTLKQMYMKYVCINYDEFIEDDIWIEGIGSIKYGLLNESCFCLTGCYKTSYLTCFYEKENLVWQNSEFNSCFMDSIETIYESGRVQRYQESLDIKISNKTAFVHANSEIVCLKIFGLNGQCLFNTLNPGKNNLEVDMKSYPPGIYLFIINNSFHVKKIVY